MRKLIMTAGFAFAANVALAANSYTVHNLVSDIPNPPGGLETTLAPDPNLVDPWGIAISASSPFWLSNAGTGLATVYSTAYTVATPAAPTPAYTVTATKVAVPSAAGGPGRVTGQIASTVFGGFMIGGQIPSFIFCTEDGTISGRVAADPNNGQIMVNNAGAAVYKGCGAALSPDGPRLYAANFLANTVDVFDTNWQPVVVDGAFVDPNLPAGLAPFNVQVFGRRVYVTYAMLGPDGVSDQAGRGNGQVNVFDLSGGLLQTISDASMNSPWGLAIAPEFYGDFSFALLVGNFGDGRINAFDTVTGQFLGTLQTAAGSPIVLEGLWGLQFGNGKAGGDAKTMYFTAGISGDVKKEAHGLFGGITAN